MNSTLICQPCLGRNAVDVARRASSDKEIQRKIVSEAFMLLAESALDMPPPYYAGKIFEIAEKYCNIAELYAEEKSRANMLAEKLVQTLRSVSAFDPADFESRLRLAAAGNILDFGIFNDLDMEKALQTVYDSFSRPIDLAAVEKLKNRIDSARNILYILDNCGEAVFDRVFMEPFKDKVTLGVRGREVFNDVAAADLAECGLENFCRKVVSSGSVIPGTLIELCSSEFQEAFYSADLVIAKGQGNFETLNETAVPAAFIFLAKCPAVTELLNAELKSVQIHTVNF